jgi:thioredoxin-dependent peroxiredoxin
MTGGLSMAALESGSKAPFFALMDQDGKKVKLSDYKGKKLLLFFYPKANASGCARQACSVSASLKDLKKLGVEAVGISPDPPDKQMNFDLKYRLGFPLLSDPDHKVAKAYGVWGEKSENSMYGKKFEGILRSSFLIDEKAKVLQAWYEVKPEDTVLLALEFVG